MPFHAAGNHVKDSTENAYYGAISSYTPSVRALAYSRDREKSIGGVQDRLVIATMTETPGLTSLPGVAQEKREVLKWLTVSLRQRSIDQPNAHKVLESFKGCTIAHFACHGYTDHADPSNSGLVFQTFTKPPKQDVLTVHKISEVNRRDARIAYLSACSTAENRVAQLPPNDYLQGCLGAVNLGSQIAPHSQLRQLSRLGLRHRVSK